MLFIFLVVVIGEGSIDNLLVSAALVIVGSRLLVRPRTQKNSGSREREKRVGGMSDFCPLARRSARKMYALL